MAKSVRTIGLPLLIVGGLLVSFSVAIYSIIRTAKRQTPRDPTV
jgi:fructose-specific phosphotransferase system IIC component